MRKDAERVFERAGVAIEGNEPLFEDIAQMLGDLRAMQSSSGKMLKSHVTQYQAQMDTFVEDLKEMKRDGKIS